jgi:hypothetical protein
MTYEKTLVDFHPCRCRGMAIVVVKRAFRKLVGHHDHQMAVSLGVAAYLQNRLGQLWEADVGHFYQALKVQSEFLKSHASPMNLG